MTTITPFKYNRLGLKVCTICEGRLFVNGQCLVCVKRIEVPVD